MIYFSSDHHFGHSNIIKYCFRPYSSIEEMDIDYIEKWNSVVKVLDLVIHCGDFSFYPPKKSKDILSILNGQKILIKGNHDRFSHKWLLDMGFSEVYKEYTLENIRIRHRPDYKYDGKMICGHVHEKWRLSDHGNILNVGVDVWNGFPISFDIAKKELCI